MMPIKPRHACRVPTCPILSSSASGYCDKHVLLAQPVRGVDNRPSASRRGYGAGWRAKREAVLQAHGIPRRDWPKYDVDHSPAYDPERDPNHDHYQLMPRLHGVHSRKTVLEDGGWGKKRATGGRVESLETPNIDRTGYHTFGSGEMRGRG
jgi:5-methylcytosine-specific restriction protein A